ncbi:MAG: DUF2197 domain-containing protein [Firmicutes bacterium]|nr:DUF2197 domain-containing protein [Bacillota bacterium]
MEVRCNICGKTHEIDKLDRNYERLAKNPTGVYICDGCSKMLSMQAAKDNEILKKS